MKEWKDKVKALEPFKYPLLLLLIGVMLMLLPGGKSGGAATLEEGFPALVSRIEGVGESYIVISDEGVVIVCRGADDPAVRYSLLQAVRAYTGFSSERITILKLAE